MQKYNSIDRRCFACGNLKENVTHVFQCTSERRQTARASAITAFKEHLAKYHTPVPMANIILQLYGKMAYRPTTYLRNTRNHRRPQQHLTPTDQWCLWLPMLHWMGPLLPWTSVEGMEACDCTLLQRKATWWPIQPDTMDEEDNRPDLEVFPLSLALPKWWITWQRLRRSKSNSIKDDTSWSATGLRRLTEPSNNTRKQSSPFAPNRRDLEMDKSTPGCLSGNSRSDSGTKRRPGMTLFSPGAITCVVTVAGGCMIPQ